MSKRYYQLDSLTKFTEDMTLTASDVVAASGTDVVLELGAGRIDGTLVIDVKTIDITSADEKYTFILQGCADSAFSGDIENLAVVELGATGVRDGGARDSVTGRWAIPITQDLPEDTEWKYCRLNVLISGTSPSIKFSSWVALAP